MDGINIFAVIAAALAAFFFGGLWYSKMVFGAVWARANGNIVGECKRHGPVVMVLALVFYFVSAFVFAALIGPQPEILYAIKTGVEIGLFFVATSFGINYLFAGRSFKLLGIDAVYHLLQFVIYGVVLGLWH